MRIGLDFDGVLGHTMDLWVDEFNRRHPSKQATIKNVDRWAFYEYDPFNIDQTEAFDIFDYCWRHWEQIKPIEVDQAMKVDRLSTLGNVDIVTAAVKNKDALKKWLSDKGIQYRDFVNSNEKWTLGYDYYIDDSPMNAENIVKQGKMCLLYDENWNRDVKTNGQIKRVYSLDHAYDIIVKLNEKK